MTATGALLRGIRPAAQATQLSRWPQTRTSSVGRDIGRGWQSLRSGTPLAEDMDINLHIPEQQNPVLPGRQ
jgi:hypothetical protein